MCARVAGQVVSYEREIARQFRREVPEVPIDAKAMQQDKRRPRPLLVDSDRPVVNSCH